MRLSKPPMGTLPERRKADRAYTPVYEPGPIGQFFGFLGKVCLGLCECVGWIGWW